MFWLCLYNAINYLKQREFNLEMHVLFINYVNTLDRVPDTKLWKVMTDKSYPEILIQMTREMCKRMFIRVLKGAQM
jgi:hypothetical protein